MVGAGHGPQPYEGIISSICEAFTCTPEEAERQDWRKVKAILDYRDARDATDIVKGRRGGLELSEYPEWEKMWDEMQAARNDR